MKYLSLVNLLILCAILISCDKENSSDVNQDKVYSRYEVFYNQNSDKTVAVARFRFGGPTGTLLELSDGAYVLYNGDTLFYNGWYSGHAKEYAGKQNPGTFTYVDVNGVSYVNTAPPMDTIDHDNNFTTLSKSQAYTVNFGGNALGANESVGMFIGSWTWGQDALFYQGQQGANNLVLGTNQMVNLAEGTSTVYMDRTRTEPVQQGTSEGGVILSKYRPTNITIQVTP